MPTLLLLAPPPGDRRRHPPRRLLTAIVLTVSTAACASAHAASWELTSDRITHGSALTLTSADAPWALHLSSAATGFGVSAAKRPKADDYELSGTYEAITHTLGGAAPLEVPELAGLRSDAIGWSWAKPAELVDTAGLAFEGWDWETLYGDGDDALEWKWRNEPGKELAHSETGLAANSPVHRVVLAEADGWRSECWWDGSTAKVACGDRELCTRPGEPDLLGVKVSTVNPRYMEITLTAMSACPAGKNVEYAVFADTWPYARFLTDTDGIGGGTGDGVAGLPMSCDAADELIPTDTGWSAATARVHGPLPAAAYFSYRVRARNNVAIYPTGSASLTCSAAEGLFSPFPADLPADLPITVPTNGQVKEVIHVSAQSGDDANSGEVATPVKTITKGLELARENNTPGPDNYALVYVWPGTYRADETFPLTVSEYVILRGHGADVEGVRLDAGSTVTGNVVKLESNSMIIGFWITWAAADPPNELAAISAAIAADSVENVLIANNIIAAGGGHGIRVEGRKNPAGGLFVYHNTIVAPAVHGLYLRYPGATVASGNVFYAACQAAIYYYVPYHVPGASDLTLSNNLATTGAAAAGCAGLAHDLGGEPASGSSDNETVGVEALKLTADNGYRLPSRNGASMDRGAHTGDFALPGYLAPATGVPALMPLACLVALILGGVAMGLRWWREVRP
ncbi:MAG: DUF1565 domain-containing protein [Candidatus Schekmanbacteria bacterium]|nr:DUF1565 domain-containing protein [Candidatus Schekmanbacteria bacterium]